MRPNPMTRRDVLGASAVSALALAASTPARAAPTGAATDETFEYQITRTDAEWRDMLSKEEYVILRKGSTELPKTSPLWKETAIGIYCCRGCNLTSYDSEWKVVLDLGWVFFKHSRANAVLTDIDGDPPEGMGDDGPGAMVEVHCRRCGSHLGHIVSIENKVLHCINGSALIFQPGTA